ncbi:hypothetical protein DQ04_00211070 [Trypanosoma grayi]|uniref:hypothetical protein n=1 Tax=Trypanosoma grayi TaxID=71804 RepID=UPI0004F47D2B|nr:hypothetical protein DQ04_00211070 [Trypanosoma grayi]KEG15024.1 hypothetical protein DQ04_00211070 [Trypanosoma grayi]
MNLSAVGDSDSAPQGDIHQTLLKGDDKPAASGCSTTAEEDESVSFDIDEQPLFPSCPYSCADGDFLHLFRFVKQEEARSIHCYSSWTVRGDDDSSLVAYVEVEDDEKCFTLGFCGATERVVGTFLQYFASGQTMHPTDTQEVRRLCICPWHRRAVLLAVLDDQIVSCVQLPSAECCRTRSVKGKAQQRQQQQQQPQKQQDEQSCGESESGSAAVDEWRVVVEHKGRGFVRFYAVERRKGSCYCDAALSQLS